MGETNHGWNGLYLFDYDDPSMKKRKKKDKIEMVINRTKSVVFFLILSIYGKNRKVDRT